MVPPVGPGMPAVRTDGRGQVHGGETNDGGQPMTDPAPLFRAEALRSRAENLRDDDPAAPGPLAQVSPRRTACAYWGLLVLMVAALAGSAQVRVGEFARGPAVVRGRMVVAVLPAFFAPGLRPGLPLMLMLPGRAPVRAAVSATGPELAGRPAASALLGPDVAPAGLLPGTLLAVRATVVPEMPGRPAGTASVQVGSERLITTLMTGLTAGSGADDG
jgi:hypothetical protein